MESNHHLLVRSKVSYPLKEGGINWLRTADSNRIGQAYETCLFPEYPQYVAP